MTNSERLLQAIRSGTATEINFGEPVTDVWGHYRLPIASVTIADDPDPIPGETVRALCFKIGELRLVSPLGEPRNLRLELAA